MMPQRKYAPERSSESRGTPCSCVAREWGASIWAYGLIAQAAVRQKQKSAFSIVDFTTYEACEGRNVGAWDAEAVRR